MRRQKIIFFKGRLISYYIFGKPDLRNPVLYFHGVPGSGLEAILAEEEAILSGLSLIAVDRPGCGDSEYVSGRKVKDFAACLKFIIDDLQIDKFSILAVSGGTPYAFSAAIEMKAKVESLLIISGISSLNLSSLATMNPMLKRLLLAASKNSALFRFSILFLLTVLNRTPCLIQVFIKLLSCHFSFTHSQSKTLLSIFKQALKNKGLAWEIYLLSQPWDLDLRLIDSPTIIVHARDDHITPLEMAKFNASCLRRCRTKFYQRGGHYLILNIIPEVCKTLAWEIMAAETKKPRKLGKLVAEEGETGDRSGARLFL